MAMSSYLSDAFARAITLRRHPGFRVALVPAFQNYIRTNRGTNLPADLKGKDLGCPRNTDDRECLGCAASAEEYGPSHRRPSNGAAAGLEAPAAEERAKITPAAGHDLQPVRRPERSPDWGQGRDRRTSRAARRPAYCKARNVDRRCPDYPARGAISRRPAVPISIQRPFRTSLVEKLRGRVNIYKADLNGQGAAVHARVGRSRSAT